MNIREIKEMLSLMNENNLAEFEFEKDGMRIRLKKGTGSQYEVSTTQPDGEQTKEILDAQKQQAKSSSEASKEVKGLIEIKVPMVGTFYRAPSPETPPYIEVGQVISKGQIICIVEAMKLMNEIKSEHKGKIVEILVNNAEPVEYGQVIMRLEPSS
ncbi:MAG: acetyl-CoA carboxylase biotin carboxyl carrier protein [Candidatus Omnitrophica bacterium]|nr:acetyl-CoA carboxylase biotin carboxyl carrier protein [Candidatus Omnitrophota bacterium]